ncbi:MAG: DUF4271 domain-containing protein [Tannerellaceae bacterium]|jgi:hypothetical protein|nr:DUF4271 domain-containing protein [Tannerellaceae bacterium]
MDIFEGYVGIRLWDEQLVNDVIFSLLLVQLIAFSLVFRSNLHLFLKMMKDVFYFRERHSIFENVTGNDFFYTAFMTFQTLSLCSIAAYIAGKNLGYINYPDLSTNLFSIGLIFFVLLSFYLFKQVIYNALGSVFAKPGNHALWRTNYHAITGLWGILLYIPVLWLVFVGAQITIPVILFVFFYIVYRFTVLYKTIRIFHFGKTGFIYIILYLCAQEILPLVFLYKGTVYLYNFIDGNTIWH